jgi:hypothetical protein
MSTQYMKGDIIEKEEHTITHEVSHSQCSGCSNIFQMPARRTRRLWGVGL